MRLSIYHTHDHSLGCISERGESLSNEREKNYGDHLFYLLGFTAAIGAHSISEEVVGFYPLWFPQGKFFVSLVFIVVHVILSDKIPRSYCLNDKNLALQS